MAIESSLAVLRNRKTHVAVREIEHWSSLRFRQERYKAATGSLDFSRGAVSVDLFNLIKTGDYGVSIYATLENGEEAHFYGTIETIRIGSTGGSGAITYHLHDLPNEIIGRGGGQQELQLIVRTADTFAQGEFAFHEIENWQTSVTNADVLAWKNQDKLLENERARRTFDSDLRLDAGLYNVSLTLLDQLGYVNRRVVDTGGVASVFGGLTAASTQLQMLYQSEMIAPLLARRAIDTAASANVADFTSVESVRESVRWERLNTVAEAVARRADLTLTAELADVAGTPTVVYGCAPSVDRRDSKRPITEQLAGEYVNAQIGDVLTRVAWLDAQSQAEPVDEFPVICSRREFWRQPDSDWKMKPKFDYWRRSLWT